MAVPTIFYHIVPHSSCCDRVVPYLTSRRDQSAQRPSRNRYQLRLLQKCTVCASWFNTLLHVWADVNTLRTLRTSWQHSSYRERRLEDKWAKKCRRRGEVRTRSVAQSSDDSSLQTGCPLVWASRAESLRVRQTVAEAGVCLSSPRGFRQFIQCCAFLFLYYIWHPSLSLWRWEKVMITVYKCTKSLKMFWFGCWVLYRNLTRKQPL